MGIDIHTLNFLKFSKSKNSFNNTITLGRQFIYINDPTLKKKFNIELNDNQKYAENLFSKYFETSLVESIDYSNYENPSITHDLNKPIPENLKNKFDTVIDSGTLEHVFNFPQAIKNCSELLKKNGQILHILPANNFSGHGFYQFSPELFFSIYSEQNGYKDTEIFLADLDDVNYWYKVLTPSNGLRATFISPTPVYILVRTVLKDQSFDHSNILQSDYIYKWNNKNNDFYSNNNILSIFRQYLKKFPILYNFFSNLNRKISVFKNNNHLNHKNPSLIKIKINTLVK